MFLIPKGYLFLQADNLLIAVLTLFKDCVFYFYYLFFLHKTQLYPFHPTPFTSIGFAPAHQSPVSSFQDSTSLMCPQPYDSSYSDKRLYRSL